MSFFLFLVSLFETEKPAIWPSKTVTYGFRLVVDDGRSVLSEEYKKEFRRAVKEWNDKTSIDLKE